MQQLIIWGGFLGSHIISLAHLNKKDLGRKMSKLMLWIMKMATISTWFLVSTKTLELIPFLYFNVYQFQ